MARITHARKVERITEVAFEGSGATLVVAEDNYTRENAATITVRLPNMQASLLDELIEWAQPVEGACPPREVTVESLIAEMQRRREGLNETWGTNKGQPRQVSMDFGITNEDADVVTAVLGTGEISYRVGDTVRKALAATVNDW